MKRTLVLGLGLLVVPAVVSAQLEVGLDAGFSILIPDDGSDNIKRFGVPSNPLVPFLSTLRVGFPAGETLLIESALGFTYASFGPNDSFNALFIMPGANFLLGDQFYVRGEAGLMRLSDSGSDAQTQYAFGGGAGIRRPLGASALLRAEVAADKWLKDAGAGLDGFLDIRAVVGVSAVIN